MFAAGRRGRPLFGGGLAPSGACSHPVPPCRPVRSLRSRRGLVVWGASALSVGVLVGLVGGPWRQDAVSPGESDVQARDRRAKLRRLPHRRRRPSADLVPAALGRTWRDSREPPCLGCHQMGDHALAAHGVSAAALADVHRRVAAGPPSTRTAFTLEVARRWPGSPLLAWSFQTRRRRRRTGRGAGLRRLSPRTPRQGRQARATWTTSSVRRVTRCRFPSFGDGHPEFAGYPYHRRTALYYNHVSHLGRHYPGVSPHHAGRQERPRRAWIATSKAPRAG